MTTLKEASDKVLKSIYSDSEVNTKEYTELDALKELQDAIKWRIKQVEKELSNN